MLCLSDVCSKINSLIPGCLTRVVGDDWGHDTYNRLALIQVQSRKDLDSVVKFSVVIWFLKTMFWPFSWDFKQQVDWTDEQICTTLNGQSPPHLGLDQTDLVPGVVLHVGCSFLANLIR